MHSLAIRRFPLTMAIVGLALSALPIAAQVPVETPVAAGGSITLLDATAKDTVFIYDLAGKSKTAANCADAVKNAKPQATHLISTDGTQQLTVSPALKKGDRVCVAVSSPGSQNPAYSDVITVEAAPAVKPDSLPTLATPVVAGSGITVTATDGATVYVYDNPKARTPVQTCPAMAVKALLLDNFTKAGSAAQRVTLSKPLAVGDQVCLESVGPNSPEKRYSGAVATVQDSTAAPAANSSSTAVTQPAFAAKIVGGSSTLSVYGQSGSTKTTGSETEKPATGTSASDTASGGDASATGGNGGASAPSISVYQFDAGYIASDKTGQCGAADIPNGRLLPIASSGGSSSSVNSAPLTGTTPPYTITLAQPLVAGTTLCLVQSGSSTQYSAFGQVTDPNDYGRVRTNFTAGTIIDNQQNSGKSSASEYLDFGIYYNWMRAGGGLQPNLVANCHAAQGCKPYKTGAPGLDSFFNVLLNQIPVSSQSTTTPSGGTAATSTTVLNLMSAQQSAQFVFGSAMTWRLTRFYSNSNFFLLGPVTKGGFNTLLNPSVNSTASASATSTTANNFSSVYDYLAAGARLSWAQFGNNTDKAPVPIGQFDVTLGTFSNLPSYICKPAHPYGAQLTTQPTTTSCFTPDNTTSSGGVVTNGFQLDAYRTLVPRLRVEGFVKLPNYPFVLGMDANLGQYSFLTEGRKIDPLSKPGNDVRIYIGVSIDPMTAIKKLGLPSQ